MKLFQSLSKEEKIDFFAKCQNLLVNYHPTSEFIFRENNIKDRIDFAKNFYFKYKGFTYSNNEICILFNKIKVVDPLNPIKVIKDHLYKEPSEDYNAYSIDFVVFRKLIDCFGFCKSQYEPRIEYIIFVRNNDVKLYKTNKLLEKLSNIPLVSWL